MPSFDETKQTLDTIYGGNLEYSSHAANAFVTSRTPSCVERALTTNVRTTALLTAAVSFAVLGARINDPMHLHH
jgi:hypothetical protein